MEKNSQQEATPQQLREVIATRLGLKTDQEVTSAVNFFNASTDFVMARSKDQNEMLQYSNDLIMIISGCLSLFRDIADSPSDTMSKYKSFSEKHSISNGNGK